MDGYVAEPFDAYVFEWLAIRYPIGPGIAAISQPVPASAMPEAGR